MDTSTNYAGYNDERLIRLITQSRQDALAELYERYHRWVFGLALFIVEDHATAEEITLEVFMRVWQKAASYDAKQARVSTWLANIARHHAIDVLRRRAVRPDYRALYWEELSREVAVLQQDLSASIEIIFRREQILAALRCLPDEQKQVLLLAYFGGYSQRQIAEMLQKPLRTIKARLRLAMQKLRAILQKEQEAGEIQSL